MRAVALQLTVVVTCRENAVRTGSSIQAALARLDTDRLARGLRLPRLASAPTAERLADLLPAPPPPDVSARILRATDGNPFHLEQVARAWDEGGRGEVPRDPAAALRARTARLDGFAGRLLAAAAVIGDRFSLDLAANAAGLARADALAGLSVAAGARLLCSDGPSPRFSHSLVREGVVGTLDPARRAALHRAVAEALQPEGGRQDGVGAPPELLAWHWREAFEPARAFRHLVAAGHRAAASCGFREALGFHEAALTLLAHGELAGGVERFELLVAIGRARLLLGELENAADAFRSAAGSAEADGWHPAGEQLAHVRRCIALTLAAGGDLVGAHGEIELGLSEAAGAGGEDAASLLLLRARLHWFAGHFDLARTDAEACASDADRIGQADLQARARELVAAARAAAGQPPAPPVGPAGPVERRHVDPLAEPALDPTLILWDGASAGDLSSAELLRLAALELARCRERGDSAAVAVALYATGAALLAAGDHDGSFTALDEALGRFRAAGSALGEALALERLAALQNARGMLLEGMELLAEGMVVAERAPLRRHLTVRLLVAQARNRLAAGALHAAEVIAREAADCAMRHGVCSTCEAALRPLQVRIALARDRLDDASAEAHILEALAEARGGRGLAATARLARARVLAAQGRPEEAHAALGEARAAFEALGRALDDDPVL
jgi:tetratricopeptide (TPR) repeat protein